MRYAFCILHLMLLELLELLYDDPNVAMYIRSGVY